MFAVKEDKIIRRTKPKQRHDEEISGSGTEMYEVKVEFGDPGEIKSSFCSCEYIPSVKNAKPLLAERRKAFHCLGMLYGT
jgi:hypothetical protein